MLKPSVVVLALTALLAVSANSQARDTSQDSRVVVGVVTRVESNAIAVRTDRGESVSVSLTPDTTYRKWIMAKPWQQDPRANIRFLKPGSRVHIDLAPKAQATAHTVWIVVGRAGGVN